MFEVRWRHCFKLKRKGDTQLQRGLETIGERSVESSPHSSPVLRLSHVAFSPLSLPFLFPCPHWRLCKIAAMPTGVSTSHGTRFKDVCSFKIVTISPFCHQFQFPGLFVLNAYGSIPSHSLTVKCR